MSFTGINYISITDTWQGNSALPVAIQISHLISSLPKAALC